MNLAIQIEEYKKNMQTMTEPDYWLTTIGNLDNGGAVGSVVQMPKALAAMRLSDHLRMHWRLATEAEILAEITRQKDLLVGTRSADRVIKENDHGAQNITVVLTQDQIAAAKKSPVQPPLQPAV